MTGKKLTIAALASVLVCGVYVSSAGATPPSSPAPVSGPQTSGVLDGSGGRVFVAAQDRIALTAATETTVTTFDLTYGPLQFSGWHSHPGIVVAVHPPTVAEVLRTAAQGVRMPRKSTSFTPKPRMGLVMRDLRDS